MKANELLVIITMKYKVAKIMFFMLGFFRSNGLSYRQFTSNFCFAIHKSRPEPAHTKRKVENLPCLFQNRFGLERIEPVGDYLRRSFRRTALPTRSRRKYSFARRTTDERLTSTLAIRGE